MLRFLFFITLVLILYYIVNLLFKDVVSSKKRMNNRLEPEELVQDPQCQTYIPKRLAVKRSVSGKDYYFCNRDCLKKYLAGKNVHTS